MDGMTLEQMLALKRRRPFDAPVNAAPAFAGFFSPQNAPMLPQYDPGLVVGNPGPFPPPPQPVPDRNPNPFYSEPNNRSADTGQLGPSSQWPDYRNGWIPSNQRPGPRKR